MSRGYGNQRCAGAPPKVADRTRPTGGAVAASPRMCNPVSRRSPPPGEIDRTRRNRMRQPARRALGIIVAGVAVIAAAAPSRVDNHPGPLTERQNARRKAAQELILSGQAAPNEDGVLQLADDKYFQAAVTGTGKVFTILSEFGDQGSGKLGTVPGPLHNEIPKPNRETVDGTSNADYNPALAYDNSTHWTSNFNEAYYKDLFFGAGDSFADFYSQQSSGAYTVAGDVGNQSDGHDGWVKVP